MDTVIFIGLFILLLISLSSSLALAQNKSINGTVINAETGNVMPGVNILVVGTTTGTITDSTGHYSVTAPSLADTLRFSFIGFKIRKIPINGRTTINVKLTPQIVSAGENLVVVGYGKQRKKSITSAVSTIKGSKLTKVPTTNLKEALAGHLPGLTVIQSSGRPGYDNTQLFLRGRSSVNGQHPLILVDGVQQSTIQYIDPNAVKSVTILKDASATAIYGVRGANGVILITTRRGHTGKPSINLSAKYGLQSFTRSPPVVTDSYEWAKLKNEAAKMSGIPPIFNEYELQQYKKGGNPLYPDINWRNLVLRDFSPVQRVNFNVAGGAAGGKVLYFIDANFIHQSGQWKLNQFSNMTPGVSNYNYDTQSRLKRYNFRSNIDAFLTKSTHAILNLAGSVSQVNTPSNKSIPYIISTLNHARPTQRGGVIGPNGQVLTTTSAIQPPIYGLLNRSGYRRNLRSYSTSTFAIKQNVPSLEGLSFELKASFNTRAVHQFLGSQSFAQYVATPSPMDSTELIYSKLKNKNQPLVLATNARFRSRFNFQFFARYTHTFGGKHHVTGLLEGRKRKTIKNRLQIPFYLVGSAMRLTYSYKSRYFFEFDAGYNGSEQFAKGNRFGFFPSVSVGWLISNEKFLKNNPVITHLKVRASVGKIGDDKLGSQRFLYLSEIHKGGNVYSPSLLSSVNEEFIGNKQIQWEVNHKINVGFEIGLYNQLNFKIDLFKQHRTNIILSKATTTPVVSGLSASVLPPVNSGIIDNKGYDIVLKYNKSFKSDFSIQSQINFDYAKNEIKDLNEVKRSPNFAYPYHEEGFSIGEVFGYITDGYFKNKKQINNYATYKIGTNSPRPGDLIYKDLNGDGIINAKDKAPLGTNLPQYNFGFSMSLKWKNFDFSFLFQGVTKVIYNFTNSAFQGVYDRFTFFKWHKHAWTPKRAAAGKPISFPALSLSSTSSSTSRVVSDFYVSDGGYIRLKNLDIGYTLPPQWSDALHGEKIRFFVNGINLITWDHLRFEGYDPESGSVLSYPIYRKITFGVSLKF